MSAYLKQQQPYQAHFETIASIIQKDDRKQFEQILIPLLMIIGGVSALIGLIVSRHLFKPVKQAYSVEQRFMQDAAHELRNPIAAIQAITQQSLEKPPKGRQKKEYTTSLHRQARHLSDMTKDL